jgi:hypothetical protein
MGGSKVSVAADRQAQVHLPASPGVEQLYRPACFGDPCGVIWGMDAVSSACALSRMSAVGRKHERARCPGSVSAEVTRRRYASSDVLRAWNPPSPSRPTPDLGGHSGFIQRQTLAVP